jgi:hypothetical protein
VYFICPAGHTIYNMMHSTRLSKLSALTFFLLCAGLKLHAQELTFLGGDMTINTDLKRSSYNWQIDYRQDLYRNLAASVAYINEGHVAGHRRDGTALELWGELPLFKDKLSLALGAGPYYYYDTQPLPGGNSANIHGTALILSFTATYYLSDRWFARFMINRITPTSDIRVETASAGLGFWFGRDKKPTPGKLGDAADEEYYVTENEFTLFTGQSVVNTLFSAKAVAYALEYRRGVMSHLDWTASAIYEGDPKIVRRNGFATQIWPVNTFFNERIAVGLGVGPYVFIDQKHPVTTTAEKIPVAVAPMVSLTGSVRLSDHWLVRVTWDRVVSNYNRDSDIFLVGLGYRWPQ